MKIGVPKEIKNNEFRVGLTPASVREYIARGHDVLVETSAGHGIAATDDDYERAGAKIAPDAEAVFAQADMVVKVKEPQPVEWKRLREDQILFTYLHLAPDPDQTRGLMESGVTAVAYETITDDQGGLPLLAPMSEVAGRLSIQAASESLRAPGGGRGVLMGGVPGVPPARILVVGGGIVGYNAARMAVGFGAEVTILDRSVPRLRALDEQFQGRVRTRYSTIDVVDEEIVQADAIIGAVLVPGANAPKIITRDMLKTMKPRAVLVDVSIDQGGCFETSKPTTHENPTYVVDDVIHYCVANMPGAVPGTSSVALNNATLPFGLKLADKGVNALVEDPHLMAGLNVHKGQITYKAVADALNVDFADPQSLF